MRIIFLISKRTGLNCLKSFIKISKYDVTVITLDDAQDHRSSLEDIVSYCSEMSIKLSVVKNNKEFEDIISSEDVDYLFVCGWYWIISNQTLTRIKKKVLGIHHSILPRYRGFSPLVWSMILGDEIVGSSLFAITEEMDDGDVYHSWEVERNNKYIGEILDEIDEKIKCEFGLIFEDIILDQRQGLMQNQNKISYFSKRNKNSGLIDWSKDSVELINFIRAQTDPYPGAFFIHNGNQFIIESAQQFPSKFYGVPGQIGLIKNNELVVCCGKQSAIIITKLKNYDEFNYKLFSLDDILGR